MNLIFYIMCIFLMGCTSNKIHISTPEQNALRYQSFQNIVKCKYELDNFTKFVSFNLHIDAKDLPVYTIKDNLKVTHVCIWGKKGLFYFSECDKLKMDEKKNGYTASYNLYKDVDEAIFDFGDKEFADKFENSNRGASMSEVELAPDGNFSDTLTFYASKNKCK